jgi:hypothetical protein
LNNYASTSSQIKPNEHDGKLPIVIWLIPCLLVCVNLYLLMLVVPKFKTIFDALGGELPKITQITLYASYILCSYSIFVAVALLLFIGCIVHYKIRPSLLLLISIITLLISAIALIPVSVYYPIAQLQNSIRDDNSSAK